MKKFVIVKTKGSKRKSKKEYFVGESYFSPDPRNAIKYNTKKEASGIRFRLETEADTSCGIYKILEWDT